MAHDDGPSKMSDIGSRLKVDANYASQYRLRLIASELIEPVGHGRVDFTMPYLRDFTARARCARRPTRVATRWL
ncbi:MAG: hypothetical protein M5U19_05565 [Microthrixaceae bacterium]|nr:hypothetical protein [Microthrixaceae bacterium]